MEMRDELRQESMRRTLLSKRLSSLRFSLSHVIPEISPLLVCILHLALDNFGN